jgi:hypothetical protein
MMVVPAAVVVVLHFQFPAVPAIPHLHLHLKVIMGEVNLSRVAQMVVEVGEVLVLLEAMPPTRILLVMVA